MIVIDDDEAAGQLKLTRSRPRTLGHAVDDLVPLKWLGTNAAHDVPHSEIQSIESIEFCWELADRHRQKNSRFKLWGKMGGNIHSQTHTKAT